MTTIHRTGNIVTIKCDDPKIHTAVHMKDLLKFVHQHDMGLETEQLAWTTLISYCEELNQAETEKPLILYLFGLLCIATLLIVMLLIKIS